MDKTLDKNSNAFTLGFASAVCVVLAILLASTYNGLKGRMDANAEFDRHKNVLIAIGLHEATDTSKSRRALEELFEKRVVGEVLEVVRGEGTRTVKRAGEVREEVVELIVDITKTDHDIGELPGLWRAEGAKPASERREFVPLYRGVSEEGETTAWCIPVSGYGLWSTLYGYLALERDLNTVKGITFYKHGETPGLGGEVDNVSWQKSWQGKKILDAKGELVGVALKKGAVDPKISFENDHMVDGLSGATITSNGVSRFVVACLETYETYFRKHRSNQ